MTGATPSEMRRQAELPVLRARLRELDSWRARKAAPAAAPMPLRIVGRNARGELVVRRRRNTVGGPIDDAARELADEAFAFFAEHVRQEIPGILAENDAAIRASITEAITAALAESHLQETLDRARQDATRSIALGLAVASVVTAVLTVALGRLV